MFNAFYDLMKQGYHSEHILTHFLNFIADPQQKKAAIEFLLGEYIFNKSKVEPLLGLYDQQEVKMDSLDNYDYTFGFIEKVNYFFISLLQTSRNEQIEMIKKKIFFTLLQNKVFDKIFSFLDISSFKHNFNNLVQGQLTSR